MKKQKSIKSLFMSQRIIALSCLVFLFLFFSCFGKNFLTKNSMVSLLESVYYIICLAFGMTFVISTGGIDLSIGSVAMCGALIGGVSYNEWHMPARFRQRYGNECDCCSCYWRHVAERRLRHNAWHDHWCVYYGGSEKRPDDHWNSAAVAGILYRPGSVAGCNAGYLPQCKAKTQLSMEKEGIFSISS